MTDERSPRVSRRQLLATTATAAAVSVAGCSGDGGGAGGDESESDGDDGSGTDDGSATTDGASGGADGSTGGSDTGGSGSGSTDTGTGTSGDPAAGLSAVDVPGEVALDEVDGLDVIETAAYEAVDRDMVPEGALAVNVTVENTGSEATQPLDYTTALWCYDGGEEPTNGTYSAVAFHRTVDPGETGVYTSWSRESADDVERYEIELACGERDDGVYCE